MKCNIWRVAERPSYIQDARFLKVNFATLFTKCYSGDQITEDDASRACDTYWGKQLHIEFWQKNRMEREHFKKLGMTNRITLQHISNKQHGRKGTGLVWLTMGYIVGAFEHSMLTLGLHKMRGISLPPQELLASRPSLYSKQLVTQFTTFRDVTP